MLLGLVDKVPGPQAGGDDVDEAEIACGGLVKSGCQSARVLSPTPCPTSTREP
jgi:hypothetical protein